MPKQTRREFLKTTGTALATMVAAGEAEAQSGQRVFRQPNVVFVFADQMRAQATGYAGDPNVRTPKLDAFARESVNCSTAVSCCPVCSPYRASLMTGQYPHTHGVFVNDVCLSDSATSIAEVFDSAGYDTAYIGKWHLDGHGRSAFIPRERRQGFDYWKVLECTHDYNHSPYYGHTPQKLLWQGYDAIAQTQEAVSYLKSRKPGSKPFALFVSWGPPHNPYETAPKEFKDLYHPDRIVLRPNVPAKVAEASRLDLAGYYAHISALDECFGRIVDAVNASGSAEDTIVVFTSDHGDMLGSQGQIRKQRPWDESILVPFLLRYPQKLGKTSRTITAPFNAPDVMPTILGLCDLRVPSEVEGADLSHLLAEETGHKPHSALIACYQPFGEWTRPEGGREYRGVRTERYTYVRDLNGPWLLYDNKTDPYQLQNLIVDTELSDLRHSLDKELTARLEVLGDRFERGDDYIRRWDYTVDRTGTVPYGP